MTTIAEVVRLREAGATFADAAARAGIEGASYQRLQYWMRRVVNVRKRIRGFVTWSWNFLSLRKKLRSLEYLFGPLTLARAP